MSIEQHGETPEHKAKREANTKRMETQLADLLAGRTVSPSPDLCACGHGRAMHFDEDGDHNGPCLWQVHSDAPFCKCDMWHRKPGEDEFLGVPVSEWNQIRAEINCRRSPDGSLLKRFRELLEVSDMRAALLKKRSAQGVDVPSDGTRERLTRLFNRLENRLDVDDDDAWMLSRSDIDYLRACLAHRAPATSSSATDSTERGWLIERNDKPSPLWWCGHSSRGMEWTPNSLEAIRFARKVDADMVNVTMLASCGVTTEHYWVAPWSPGRNVQNETAPAPSPALAAIVEAGDAMRNYFDETTLTMNRVKDKDAPGLMWALTEEYVSGATPILTDWDRARAALPKDGA